MVFYTKNGEPFNYCVDRVINSGTQGRVSILDDNETCLKEYIESKKEQSIFDDFNNRFTEEMFNYFREKNYANFCKIYELLYDKRLQTVVGYTMKYYKQMIDSMLFLPKSFLLDNFCDLYNAIENLTNECIRVVDLNNENIILTNDGMVVIDYDKYFYEESIDIEQLRSINRSALMYAFKKIVEKSLKEHGILLENNPKIKMILNYLFTENTSPITLKCKLNNCSIPMDIFYKR